LPTIDIIHETFARQFTRSISAAMQRIIEINALNTSTMKFGDFIRQQSIPSSYQVFRIKPYEGMGLVVLEGKLVFTMVNSFFGGKGAYYYKYEGQGFTPIEDRLISTVIGFLLKDYDQAWKDSVQPDLELSLTRSEMNPQFVAIVPSSEAVWVTEIEMVMDDTSERLFFCLPNSTLEPMKEKLKARFQTERAGGENIWENRLSDTLRNVPVEVRANLGSTEMTARRLLELKAGDVIQLDESVRTPLEVAVENVVKFRGLAGSANGCNAVKVTEVVGEERK
jgi:flagellar motor switch protein FliM